MFEHRIPVAKAALGMVEAEHFGPLTIESLRALLTARRGAVKARTAAINQIKALLITAPADLRERYRRHTTTALIRALARCRPAGAGDPPPWPC